jgi:phycobilisome core component
LKAIAQETVAEAGITNAAFLDQPFDYMARELSEKNI